MRTPDDRAHTNSETERLDRPERVETVERVERVVPVAPVAPVAPTGQVNVNAARTDPVWSVTRVVVLLFTVLEVLLLVRFILKFAAANADQSLVSAIYGVTEPLVRPFQGIFGAVTSPVVVDIPALLAILFLFGVAALIVALVRAIQGRSA